MQTIQRGEEDREIGLVTQICGESINLSIFSWSVYDVNVCISVWLFDPDFLRRKFLLDLDLMIM